MVSKEDDEQAAVDLRPGIVPKRRKQGTGCWANRWTVDGQENSSFASCHWIETNQESWKDWMQKSSGHPPKWEIRWKSHRWLLNSTLRHPWIAWVSWGRDE